MGIQLRQHRMSAAAFTVLVTLGLPYTACADVTISTSSTHNIKCSDGVCAPTRKNAVLNVRDLKSLLKSGNVEVTTTGSGIEANNIFVSAELHWSSTGGLSLSAYQSILVRAPVSVGGLGGISLTTNRGNGDGMLKFERKGRIAIKNLSASLSINSVSYTLVNTVKGLATAISQNPNVAVAFANNYDASADGTYSTPPILTTFGGRFEGLGNAISNLSIDDSSDSYVALFATTNTGAEINDVNLPNVSVTATATYLVAAAALIAELYEASVSGSVASGKVSASYAGGLVGLNDASDVFYSSAHVAVTGGYAAGGLVGGNSGSIAYSSATGAVSTTFSEGDVATGGLVGGSGSADISQSFATGAVSAVSGAVGGLVGEQTSGVDYRSSVEDSLATGSVTGGSGALYVGGLVGFDYDSTAVSYAYSTGYVTGGSYTGGFIGYDESSPSEMTDTYWDTDTSGISNPSQGAGYPSNDPGITGETTAQLQSGLPAGFDPTVWAEKTSINNGLPYLINNPPPQ